MDSMVKNPHLLITVGSQKNKRRQENASWKGNTTICCTCRGKELIQILYSSYEEFLRGGF